MHTAKCAEVEPNRKNVILTYT